MNSVKDGDLLTVTATAQLMGVKACTVRKWIADGELPAIRVSRKIVRVRGEAISAWLQEHETKLLKGED